MEFETKIVGGTIVDGTGQPGFRGDIGIAGGKIVAVGKADGEAQREIDAGGLTVAPGFVQARTLGCL